VPHKSTKKNKQGKNKTHAHTIKGEVEEISSTDKHKTWENTLSM